SSRRRHTRSKRDWSSDVCSSDLEENPDRVHPFSEDFDKNKYIKLYTNNKSGKAGRATWFLADKDVIKKNRSYVKEWQVVVSSAKIGRASCRERVKSSEGGGLCEK